MGTFVGTVYASEHEKLWWSFEAFTR